MSIQMISPLSVRLGVVGAGTMGSGIALAALLAGVYVTLYDVQPEMLERAHAYIDGHLAKKNKAGHLPRLRLTGDLEELKRCNLVVEAAPEDLALKQELFGKLDRICPPPAILATNTSTLAVTAIAAAAGSPGRVAGMHFFNPAPVLPLVEVIRAAQTAEETVQTVVAAARLLGKTPVVVKDTPGFIVNRVARPFYGEALRLAGEGTGSFEQIDTIVRQGGGFKMGPFQLMDLIGIDINLAAMQSMYEQTFGEPRYRPHPIQVQMVQQKALGRKTGRGFYDYHDEAAAPGQAKTAQRPRRTAQGQAVFVVDGGWVPRATELCREAGYPVNADAGGGSASPLPAAETIALLGVGAREGLKEQLARLERRLPAEALILAQCADVTAAELTAGMEHPRRLVGFDGLFLNEGDVITLTAGPRLSAQARQAAEAFAAGLGKRPVWVEDTPGLVLPRMVCMLANEAAFAAGEGVAEPEVIDQAMKLGVNYPRGPLEWARRLGIGRVVRVLDYLHEEYGEERYRVAPLLRRWARLET